MQFVVSAAAMFTAIFVTFFAESLHAVFSCAFVCVSISTSKDAACKGEFFFTSGPLVALHSRKIQRFDLGVPVMCQRGDVMTVEFLQPAAFELNSAGPLRNQREPSSASASAAASAAAVSASSNSSRFWAVGVKQLVPEAEYLAAVTMCAKAARASTLSAPSTPTSKATAARADAGERAHREACLLELAVDGLDELMSGALTHRHRTHTHTGALSRCTLSLRKG